MASFNPDLQVSESNVRDQTGVSRGTGTDRSFETLFSGLGDLIGGAANTADQAIQNRIERDARYGFDALNDESNLSVNTVPQEITSSSEGLQRLAEAQMQGKVTQEYYYHRLASTLKGLRAKYPGYEKEVDSIVQNVTGVRPANAFRDALWANIEATQRAAATASGKFDSWAAQKENSEVLGVLYPDFWTNQEKYASDEAKNQIRANVSQYQGRLRIAEDTVKLQSADKEIARPQVGRLFSTVVNGYIVGGSEAAGIDSPNVQTMLSNALSDGQVDQNEKENILGFIAQIRAKAEVEMRNRVSSSDWGSNFKSSEINEEIKNAIDPLTQMEALVTSDNVSAAVRIAERNKAVTDQATFDLYQKFPELQVSSALRNISQVAADTVVNNIIEKSGGGNSFLNRVLGKDLATGVANGTVSLSQITDNVSAAQGKTGKEKEQILSQVLDTSTSILAAPDASREVQLNTIRSVYSDNLDSTWNVVDNTTGGPSGVSQRMRLFSKMFNPQITKQIASLNDPQSMNTYVSAALDKFQQIPEFRTAAVDLQEGMEWNKYARVKYDTDRNRLIVETNSEALSNAGTAQSIDQRMWTQRLIKRTNAFNQALNVMAPIIEAQGGDELEVIRSLTNSLSLDLEAGHKSGFFYWVNEALGELGRPLNQSENERRSLANPNETGTWEEIGNESQVDTDDPILWDVPDGAQVNGLYEAQSSKLSDQGDIVGDVLKANYAPEGRQSSAQQAITDLVSSRARGYQPDLDNLDSGFRASLAELQSTFGSELPIVSGYRDPERNRKAGGARKSRHMHGDAVDIDVGNMSREDRIRLIQTARSMGFGGVGIYPNSIHLDKGRTRSWGPTYRNSSLPKWARDALGG